MSFEPTADAGQPDPVGVWDRMAELQHQVVSLRATVGALRTGLKAALSVIERGNNRADLLGQPWYRQAKLALGQRADDDLPGLLPPPVREDASCRLVLAPLLPVHVIYKNYRGDVASRHIVPHHVWHGTTEHHAEAQWLVEAWDVDKRAWRSFTLRTMEPLP